MNPRLAVGALTLSAAAFVGLVAHEGYTDKPVQPLPGDKWTQGFGSTTKADGSPVKPGDTTAPVPALAQTLRDVRRFEGAVKECVKVPLTQYEYDAYVRFSYNVGAGKEGVADGFCYLKEGGNSTIVRRLNAGDYAGACAGIEDWVKFRGRDCRVRSNGCYGLVTRRAEERAVCEGRA